MAIKKILVVDDSPTEALFLQALFVRLSACDARHAVA